MFKFALFDTDPAAQNTWQSSLESHSFRFSTGNSIEGLRNAVHDDTMVVVVDISLAPSDFVTLLGSCAVAQPQHIYIGTGSGIAVNHIVGLMRLGVSWIFDKPLRRSLILDAMPKILALTQATAEQLNEYRSLCTLFQALTARERQVLNLIMDGVSNKDSGLQLEISIRTVESRRARIYQKFGTDNMVALTRKIERLNMLHARFGANKSENHLSDPHSQTNTRSI